MAFEGIKWGRVVEVKQLRRGGMADVYLVKRLFDGFERSFVIKRIQERFVHDKLARDLFRAEARLHATFEHPHIVQFLDFGSDEAFLYMVLEYVSGGDLFASMSAREYPDPRQRISLILRAFEEIASALVVVHRIVVHRDLSPCNILVTADKSFKLNDFGLAHPSKANDVYHQSIGRGKVRYMAPESIAGGPSDARADLFSLAATMTQAFLGEALYKGKTTDQIPGLLRTGAYLNYFRNLHLPEGLAEIVLRSVQPNPRDRYQSAEELLFAVRNSRARALLCASEALSRRVVLARPVAQTRSSGWAKVISALLILPVWLLLPWFTRPWSSKGPVKPSEPLAGRRPS